MVRSKIPTYFAQGVVIRRWGGSSETGVAGGGEVGKIGESFGERLLLAGGWMQQNAYEKRLQKSF